MTYQSRIVDLGKTVFQDEGKIKAFSRNITKEFVNFTSALKEMLKRKFSSGPEIRKTFRRSRKKEKERQTFW